MIDSSEAKILSMLRPSDVVLDIGGWARPFNRANYVMDRGPYRTRGEHYLKYQNLGPQGGDVEYFTADTWLQVDICDHAPWPFADKSIDFCICSHTLEDIRDPLSICHEMLRVAKAGYIEIPSRLFETSRGREPGVPVGLSHHRWMIELEGSHLTFYPKDHRLHGDPRLSLPKAFGAALTEDQLVTKLFWEGSFTYAEAFVEMGDVPPDRLAELRSFLERTYRYTPEQSAAFVEAQAEYEAKIDAIGSGRPLDRNLRADPAHAPADLGATLDALRAELDQARVRLDAAFVEAQAEYEAKIDAIGSGRPLDRNLRADPAHAPADLGATLDALRAELDQARVRLDGREDLGPLALGVARRLQRLSRSYPRAASLAKRVAGRRD